MNQEWSGNEPGQSRNEKKQEWKKAGTHKDSWRIPGEYSWICAKWIGNSQESLGIFKK